MPEPITPKIAVDIVIEMVDRPGRPIVLIERRYEPFGWALPGGFVDVGERLEQAAIREARAMDDARNLAFYHMDDLPKLAFDHDLILSDYRQFRLNGRLTPLRDGAN